MSIEPFDDRPVCWTTTADGRVAGLDYNEPNWPDNRPNSLPVRPTQGQRIGR
ncbi:hypothetical protein HGK72_31880 [Mycolicibacterium fortuitum]|uniref:hypothetical protein n=1 Tax=Mycolicibacterium fortuitum TaxID=1766 RepID=UPI0013F4F3EF|nr:hypothetical protein [Mycolicibacterium fortuitum]NOR04648.1 hypothetical protein [Mycolicibacterium fortuitum]UBV20975.1 hypothetical protein H8Z59_27880 [Mycolicibacterium fortuitum]